MDAMRKVVICFACCLFIVGGIVTADASAAKKGPIKIGATQGYTGPIAQTELIMLKGIRHAVAAINATGGVNGRLLELMPVDSKSDPVKTVSDLKRMVHRNKVTAILCGPMSTANIPAKKWAEDNQFPVFSSNSESHTLRGSEWYTDFGLLDSTYVEAICKHLSEKGLNRLAFIHNTLAWGMSTQKLVNEFAPKYGIKIVIDEVGDPGSKDLTIQANKMKAANPDVIYAQCYQGAIQALMIARKAMNWKIPVFMHYSWIHMIGNSNPVLMEGAQCAHWENMEKPEIHEVWDKYEKWSGERNEHCYIALGWDMVHVLAAALKACGNDLSPKRVRDEYFKLRYPLVTGKAGKTTSLDLATKQNIQFDMDDTLFYRFTNGKFVLMR
jgi:ABC-type branched-subunit amino acid transport system substrate-binding protein